MTGLIEQAWSETFRYATERSPFYRDLFRDINGVPRLDELPLVDKRVLSERNLDFLCVPREEVVEIATTSGTMGKPLLWMHLAARSRQRGVRKSIPPMVSLNWPAPFASVTQAPEGTFTLICCTWKCWMMPV